MVFLWSWNDLTVSVLSNLKHCMSFHFTLSRTSDAIRKQDWWCVMGWCVPSIYIYSVCLNPEVCREYSKVSMSCLAKPLRTGWHFFVASQLLHLLHKNLLTLKLLLKYSMCEVHCALLSSSHEWYLHLRVDQSVLSLLWSYCFIISQ